MMRHLLLTNDYPPKVGGIQTYLWELWRRLPPDAVTVLTSPHDDAPAFDADQAYDVHRYDRFWLPPTGRVRRRAVEVLRSTGARAVIIDPAWPLGSVGPALGVPYAVVLHGAEVTVPARLPGARAMLRRAVAGASMVISASRYAETEARRVVSDFPPVVYVPPGVDTDRFVPLGADDRIAARRRLGLDPHVPLVLGVSRLVPRKGFDRLIDAAARLRARHPDLEVVIAGTGRDEARLRRRIARTGAPVRLLGHVSDDDLPALYGCADGFAMLCRERWGGMEQEGFGIVFVEAAAAGCPQIAGRSGGSAEAVAHGETGWIVEHPDDVDAVAEALHELLERRGDESLRAVSREHAVANFGYDLLAERLGGAIADLAGH